MGHEDRSALVWRVLDANANRAREGLRVVEDTARFVLNHPQAASAVRSLRHRLDGIVRNYYGEFLRHRDIERDVGRENPSLRYNCLSGESKIPPSPPFVKGGSFRKCPPLIKGGLRGDLGRPTGFRTLLAANFKRCSEALRVLEEYGRVMSPQSVRNIQAVRYQVYQWEKRLLANRS